MGSWGAPRQRGLSVPLVLVGKTPVYMTYLPWVRSADVTVAIWGRSSHETNWGRIKGRREGHQDQETDHLRRGEFVQLLSRVWLLTWSAGFRAPHYLPGFAQTPICRVGDAIQLSRAVSQLFTSDGQSIRASASSSVLSMSIQGWFPSGLTGLISSKSKGLSRIFASTTIESINSSGLGLLYGSTHIHTWLL